MNAVTANPEQWADSQRYELDFWINRWPYRDLPMDELQQLRQRDAEWLLGGLGFKKTSDLAFGGFKGTVLEVGCGPLGFFELTENVDVTAIDSLMGLYAKEIPYSTLGRRGNTTYVDRNLQDITDRYRFVVCSNVLDHTADWLEFLELLVDHVDEDGEFLLFTDTRGVPMTGHTQVYTPDQVVRCLRWLGFDNVKHEHRDSPGAEHHCDQRFFLRVSR